MIGMDTQAMIRDLWDNGESISSIARALHIDRKTVRKFLDREDYSESIQEAAKQPRGSKLDRYKAEIDALIEKNEKIGVYRKQKWTAVRMHEYLVVEKGYCELKDSYNLIARYMRSRRQQKSRGYEERGAMPLVWYPGEAEGDFGEADCYLGSSNELTRLKYFCLKFPYSNVEGVVFMPGENCECVCQALQYIFEYIGGVPGRIIFDNATGIGHRFRNILQENEGFTRFRLHYRFKPVFANPDSGHEKGSVENGVGTARRNLMVPPPRIAADLEDYNKEHMLPESIGFRIDEPHYLKGITKRELFERERESLLPLPSAAMHIHRIERHTLDATGSFITDAKHKYSIGPQRSGSTVLVEKTAWDVIIYDGQGHMIKGFRRSYSDDPTQTYDLEAIARSMYSKPGSWHNSVLRSSMEDGPLKEHIDSIVDRNERKRFFWGFGNLVERYSLGSTCYAYNRLIHDGKLPDYDDVSAYCERLRTFSPDEACNPTGVNLGIYDALLSKEAK